MCEAYVLHRLLHDGERGKSEKVHLDEARLLDDVSVILCGEELVSGVRLVLSRRHRHPVADGVAADDGAAGVDARSADGALQHLGVLYGVGKSRVGACLRLLQFRHFADGVGQIHLLAVLQLIRYGLAQAVRYVERQLLHTCHVLDGVLRSHRAVGDDVRHLVVSVLVHPFEHLSASVVVEVGVDIRERDTVRIEESLEQKIVFYRVNLGDAEAVSHNGSGS